MNRRNFLKALTIVPAALAAVPVLKLIPETKTFTFPQAGTGVLTLTKMQEAIDKINFDVFDTDVIYLHPKQVETFKYLMKEQESLSQH